MSNHNIMDLWADRWCGKADNHQKKRLTDDSHETANIIFSEKLPYLEQ